MNLKPVLLGLLVYILSSSAFGKCLYDMWSITMNCSSINSRLVIFTCSATDIIRYGCESQFLDANGNFSQPTACYFGGNNLGNWRYCTPDNLTEPKTIQNPTLTANSCGSIIRTDKQVLSELIPLTGIPFSLAYSSDRVLGRKDWLEAQVPVTPVSSDLSSVYKEKLTISVAGKVFNYTFNPTSNLVYNFSWDGLDQNNNLVTGTQHALITTTEIYEPAYEFVGIPDVREPPYYIILPTSNVTNYTIAESVQTQYFPLGSIFLNGYGFGGWDFSIHHHYDQKRTALYLGDGRSLNISATQKPNGDWWVVSSEDSEVYIFDSQFRHITTRERTNHVTKWSFTYDTSDKLVAVIDKYGNQTTVQYSGQNIVSITSPFGIVTQIGTDANGYISSVTNPASETYEMTYSSSGLLLTFEKPSGVTATMVYDVKGKLLSDVSSAGSSTTLSATISGVNPTITETTTVGRVTSHEITLPDSKYVRKTTFPNQKVLMYDENFSSNITSISEPQTNYIKTTQLQDDPLYGAPAKIPYSITEIFGSGSMALSYTETPVLATPGDPTSLATLTRNVNVNNKSTQTVYTASNKTAVTTSPEGRVTTQELNSLNDLASTQYASFIPIDVTYDTQGRVTKHSQGLNRSTTYTYHTSNGLLATIKNALMQETLFAYDSAGRVNKQTLPDGREINFSYDVNGNLQSVIPPGKPVHTLNHNGFDLLGSYVPPAIQGVTNTSTVYVYNDDRQLISVSRPDGQTFDFNYGAVTGELDSINLPTGNRTFEYNKDELTKSISEDFVSRFFYYNKKYVHTETVLVDSRQFSVFYNNNNDFLPISETVTVGPLNMQADFSYDNDNLLVAAGDEDLIRSPTTGFLTQIDLGNLSQFLSYSSDFGELSGIEAVYSGNDIYQETMTRDHLGRIATRTETYGTGSSKVYAYTYDTAGRLTDVTLNGSPKSHYEYNSNSNRIGQTIDGVVLSAGSTTTSSTDSSVNLGTTHTCAITNAGIKCWGIGLFGQLGYGNTSSIGVSQNLDNLTAVDVPGTPKSIGLGSNYTCALFNDGSVRCWGQNTDGQLGLGHMNNIGDNELPSTVSAISIGGTAKKIAVGQSHACALRTDNQVVCWGSGSSGRLGYANTNNIGDDELPSTAGVVSTGATTDIKDLVVGNAHTCILTTDGNVKCWGRNNSKQLGTSNTLIIGDNETPAAIGFLNIGEAVTEIAAGGEHTCVVTQSNKLKCWGRNDVAQLGLGNLTTPTMLSTTLPYVDVGADVKKVTASMNTTCVITTADQAKCWGENNNGQLGLGHTNTIGDNETPSTIGTLSLGGSITQIDASNDHTCAFVDTGDVFCWGLGSGGRLGHGNLNTIGDDETPQSVGNISGIELEIPQSTPAIAYDDQDRLLTFGTKTFTYNENGELESETDSATSVTKSYVYDVLGNLKSVTLPNKTINYGVDAHNRRTFKKNGTTAEQYFIWNKYDQLVGVTDGSGTLTARFVYGSKSHVPDYMVMGSVNYQIVSNHLGSPVAVVNTSTGTVAQEITYDEFGNILSDTSPGFTPFGFGGCLYDADTKLCRFGARDYDSSIGRWLSKDPILFAGGDPNLYGYVMQDPINLIDPMGTKFINTGVSVPTQVQNSQLYQTIAADPNVTVLLSNFSDPRYFGLTTGNSVQINAALHRGNYNELVDTFIDELSHVYGNNYYGRPTTEAFDHNFLKPSFLNDPSIKNSNQCGFK